MRKCVLLIAALVASPLFAKGPASYLDIKDFHCGVDSYHSSLTIDDCFVQDSLNVYFDKVSGAQKRGGFTTSFSSSAFSYSGAWSYTDNSANIWMIVRSSNTLMATTGIGTSNFNVKIATVSANDVVNCTTAQGNFYCVDPTQAVYYWNGSSTTYIAGSPHGSLIANFHGRVWISGLSVPNGNFLYGSKYLDGTTWTTGVNATDPVALQVNLLDNADVITTLFPGYNDVLYVMRNYNIYGLVGFDQTDFQIGQLNTEVGCIDQRGIQPIFGGLVFPSARGIEFFDGYTATRISDPIKNLVDPITLNSSFNQNSWIQSTNNDYSTWTTQRLDTTTLTNQVQLTAHVSDNFTDLSNWNQRSVAWSVAGNTATGPSTNGSALVYKTPISSLPTDNWREGVFFTASGCNVGPNGNSASIAMVDSSTSGYIALLSCNQTIFSYWSVDIWKLVNGSISAIIPLSGTYGTSDGNQHYLELQQQGTALSMYLDGVSVMSGTDATYSGLNIPYLGSNMPDAGISEPGIAFQNFKLGVTSGTFKTAIHNVGSITSWGNFSVVDSLDGGTIDFSICSSTNSDMSYPIHCSMQIPNAQISIATSTYVQYNGTFTIISSSQNPRFNSATVNWYSGTRKPPMASMVYDNRYWLSVSTTTTDSTNDATLVMSKGPVWSPFSIGAGAFVIWKNQPYFASAAATGKVYQLEQGLNDDGAAINAYIRTKDYAPAGLIDDKYWDSIYLIADNLGAYNLNTSYFLDRSTVTYSLGTMVQNETPGTLINRLNIPIDSTHQNFSKTISFKFSNSDVDAPLRIYGGSLKYHGRPPQ